MIKNDRAEPAATAPVATTVRPLSAAEAVLLLEDPDRFTAATGLHLATAYLAFPEALPHIVQGLQAGASPEWGSQLIIDQAGRRRVGGPGDGGQA